MRTELEKIYLERENKMIELIKTLSWEEARNIVDEEYKEQLLSICPEKPLKRGFCIDGKPVQFEILGITENSDYLKPFYIDGCEKYDRPYINGERMYSRLLIKRVS